MKDGLIKIGAVTPKMRLCSVEENVVEMIGAAKQAAAAGVRVLVFPELCLAGASAWDLYLQTTLLEAVEEAVCRFASETAELDMISFIGAPVSVRGALYNAAVAVSAGRVLGVVPKSSLCDEERRYFSSAPTGVSEVALFGGTVPFGTDILFECQSMPSLLICAEVGSDLFAPISPSGRHTASGATVVASPAAILEAVGSRERTRLLVTGASLKGQCAYLLAGAGAGESGTGGVYSAHSVIAERGHLVAESEPYTDGAFVTAVIDLEKIAHDRRRFFEAKSDGGYTYVPFSLAVTETKIDRAPRALPFVPMTEEGRRVRATEILEIQARALAGRIERSYSKSAVIGVSGGLDSTLALLVTARAFDLLGRDRGQIISVTMPCFGTTARTKGNAEALAEALGTTLRVVDIKEAVDVHFRDIGHGEGVYDVVYENAQARERTQVLMDIANAEGGLVVGTGDLSELALGFATYNGDHMSMYAPNADVPKTLLRHIVGVCAKDAYKKGNTEVARVLCDILDTPVSPELLPPKDGDIAQCTEKIVGPYELHDYFLYYLVRFGFSPSKIYRLAKESFKEVYAPEVVLDWLRIFVRRFFAQQFKRSCLPDGPRVASVSFSPRGDWKMPSDASVAQWLKDLEKCK